MNELTQVLEKISTLNINANTNIDIQSIVEKFVLFDMIKNVGITFILLLIVVVVSSFVYKAYIKALKVRATETKTKELEKFLEDFQDWRDIKTIKQYLEDIIAYMPRNKRKNNLKQS